MGENDELVMEFLVESNENLDRLDQDLLALEENPTDRETLASIFRTIHTIKGTCGFLGFSILERVTHVGESLLSRLRDGELTLTEEMTSVLLRMVDAVRQMLRNIEATTGEGTEEYADLVEDLRRLREPAGAEGAAPAADDSAEEPEPAEEPEEEPEPEVEEVAAVKPEIPEVPEALETVDEPEQEESVPEQEVGKKEQVVTPKGSSIAESKIRVDVNLLDELMTLVGELVLTRNQILQHTFARDESGLTGATQRLNLITTELQEGVMKTRMQPIGNVWNKFPRVARDLALACGKKVKVVMDGKETELDRTILEAIKDPLTHIVRNSVDHGLESPEERKAAGKNPEGTVLLRAFHEGGQVNIEITDDGKGLNVEKIKAKAIERGLITPEQAGRMGDREIQHMLFMPGFSTAEKVTNVSGRGVGMDVVRTNIEKIGGTVDMTSTEGVGTSIKIKIPLTLAIIPALIVKSGSERFAIPQVSLLELVRLESEQARTKIESIHNAPVYRLRGKLLPLVFLNEILGMGTLTEEIEDGDRAVNIVVLQADERQFGLVVDGVHDTEEIVVKPLGKTLKGMQNFAGATIMGDGSVALILDVLGIAQVAHVIASAHEKIAMDTDVREGEEMEDRQTLLLFRNGSGGRMAIPLSMVARLEEFKKETVEQIGSQRVIQYRDQIMPLIFLSEVISGGGSMMGLMEEDGNDASDDSIQVVVYSVGQKSIGLVVDRIHDIVDTALTARRDGGRSGVVCSVVIQEVVTEVLDVEQVIRSYDPSLLEETEAA